MVINSGRKEQVKKMNRLATKPKRFMTVE